MEAVELRRSRRARRWRLEVPWGGPARLTVPVWTSAAEIHALLDEWQPWIEDRRRAQVPRLGLERLGLSETQARAQTRAAASALARSEGAALGVSYTRIRIAGQRTRFGS